jgi:hypothetical protein
VSRGKSDISSSAAAFAEATARRPRLLVRVAVKVALYLAQPPLTTTCRAVASVPAASLRETVSVLPLSARAHTEKSYLLPCSTRMPVL